MIFTHMKRKQGVLLIPFFFFATVAYSQVADSLIFAEGKIMNAETKEPVTARITYQSLPYGNMVGVVNNNVYSFPMLEQTKYSITVEASGYDVAKYMLDPSEANSDGKLIKHIELSKGAKTTGEMTLAVGNVIRLDNLIFQVGKSKISEESYAELNVLNEILKEHPSMVIQLEGHTDYVGDAKENMRLSQARVDAVRDHLVSKGIGKNRIKTKAFGGTVPISRDDTPEGHRMNRRVELRILEK
jgi:outer membrane protein OmpA-like peptidoglycan-associated protein